MDPNTIKTIQRGEFNHLFLPIQYVSINTFSNRSLHLQIHIWFRGSYGKLRRGDVFVYDELISQGHKVKVQAIVQQCSVVTKLSICHRLYLVNL